MGETLFQILGSSGSALDVPDAATVLDIAASSELRKRTPRRFLKPSTVHDAFAQDLSKADRWLIVASQRPITLGAKSHADGDGRLEVHTELGRGRN